MSNRTLGPNANVQPPPAHWYDNSTVLQGTLEVAQGDRRKARLTVAEAAVNKEDAADLLAMLGIADDTTVPEVGER